MSTMRLNNNDLKILRSCKLMVMGYKRHGKDTVCEYLYSKYGITFTSSSHLACDLFIFDKIKNVFGYKNKEECFEDRLNHRRLWYTLINDYNTPDLAKLGKKILNKYNAYCGPRHKDEFLEIKSLELFDMAIWVNADERHPPESEESMSLTKDYADVVLDNNKDKFALEQSIDNLVVNVILPHTKQKLLLRKNIGNTNFNMTI